MNGVDGVDGGEINLYLTGSEIRWFGGGRRLGIPLRCAQAQVQAQTGARFFPDCALRLYPRRKSKST